MSLALARLQPMRGPLHVHADYAPPRSWDQFEELCADLFEAEWRDPTLVRHGRAGQKQNGVDIVGRSGAVYPIGLQCKKKSVWPVAKLTTKQIDAEVTAARGFSPALKVFYILTTAPDSQSLQAHVRTINQAQKKARSFEVVLLGWGEIVRRVTCHARVADKHFGLRGSPARSPLLATFALNGGRLVGRRKGLELAVRELLQDFRDDPSGHVVVRQQESDGLAARLSALGVGPLSAKARVKRIDLRDQLYRLERQETRAADGVRLMLTDPEMTEWLVEIWDPKIAVEAVISFLDTQVVRSTGASSADDPFLRMSPPFKPDKRASARLASADMAAIQDIMAMRTEKFGEPLTTSVAELPAEVLSRVAVPRLIRDILESQDEDRLSLDELRLQGRFDLGNWTVSVA